MLKKQLFIYCLLAYVISWLSKFFMAAPGAGLFNHPIPQGLLQLFAQFGPSIAGVIMIAATGGKKGIIALISNLARTDISLKWFFFAIFFEPVLFIVIVSLGGLSGLNTIVSGAMAWLEMIKDFFINLFYLALLTGLAEEIGWRGFLLPGLQSRLPIIKAAVILALVNSFWHLRTSDMAILLTGHIQEFWWSFLPDMGIRILISIPVIFVIVYLFNKTKGSLLIMILFHGASNASYEWVKEITGNSDPSYMLPYFAGILWVCSVFFIPALLKQAKDNEIITHL